MQFKEIAHILYVQEVLSTVHLVRRFIKIENRLLRHTAHLHNLC